MEQLIFKGVIVFTIIQRVSELFLSNKNQKKIIENGGFVAREPNYILMVLLHSTWLIYLTYMGFVVKINPSVIELSFFLFIFLLGQILRLTAIFTLGPRWTTRVVIANSPTVVKNGIFKYINHPNYLGVVLEIFALPAMGGLYLGAILFSILNAIILYFRLKLEVKLLSLHNNYNESFN